MKALWLMLLVACQPSLTQYPAQVTARHELVLEYDGHFSAMAEGKTVARGLKWDGLTRFVVCSERAAILAQEAESDGRTAVGLSIAGGILGGSSVGALAAFASPDPYVRIGVLAGGVGMAVIGTVLGALSHRYKHASNGKAIDAINIYNDEVGAWGQSCVDPK